MRLLIFTLSVGFFIWLPSAVADSGGGLSVDAPAHLRQVQNSDNALLTLTVKNIQVHADWHVTSDGDVFTINDGKLQRTLLAKGTHVATVYAVDRFDRLNPNYANLTASAVITVEFVLGTELYFADAPSQLVALARLPEAVILYQFTGTLGVVPYTYNLVGGNEAGYFALTEGGELSLPSDLDMRGGIYDLRVKVSDSALTPNQATAVVRVRIVPNQVYVMGGFDIGFARKSDVWSSLDDKTWKLETADGGWSPGFYKQAVSHNGRMYIMGGYSTENNNDVWSSMDGKNWSFEGNASWSERTGHAAVTHKGRIYVLGGANSDGRLNDVWSSADGKSWSREQETADWPARYYHQAVFHNERFYVLGGKTYRNDVWSSADAKNWSFEGNADWSGRDSFQALSYNGRIYVLAGDEQNGLVNDNWSSVNGKNWVRENGVSPPIRSAFQAYARNGMLYLLGGIISPNSDNDMWSSADGKDWVFGGNADWSKRYSFQAVVHPPPLFLSGTSEVIILSEGTAKTGIATVTAQHGFGAYTYLLESGSDFDIDNSIDNSIGVLSYNGTGSKEEYLVTVRVEDADGSQAKTIIRVKIE